MVLRRRFRSAGYRHYLLMQFWLGGRNQGGRQDQLLGDRFINGISACSCLTTWFSGDIWVWGYGYGCILPGVAIAGFFF